MPLSNYQAIGIAEGFEPAESNIQVLEAWSHIGKNELHRHLQGFFGRTLQSLVDEGFLTEDYDITEDAMCEFW